MTKPKRPAELVRPKDLIDRFWLRVDKVDDCWIWTGGTSARTSLPIFFVGREGGRHGNVSARKWAYEHFVGPVPDGCIIGLYRSCDSPLCVNPGHIDESIRFSTEKKCSECSETKPLGEFYQSRGGRLGVGPMCKKCKSVIMEAWRKENPEKVGAHQFKAGLKRGYNLSPADYIAMLEAQDSRCAICLTDNPGGKGRFHVDHDSSCCPARARSCGRCIRGLLCHNCNVGLGHFHDDVTALRQAITYLEQTRRAA